MRIEVVGLAGQLGAQMGVLMIVTRHLQSVSPKLLGGGSVAAPIGDVARMLQGIVVVGKFLQRLVEEMLGIVQPIEAQQDEAISVEVIGAVRLGLQRLSR